MLQPSKIINIGRTRPTFAMSAQLSPASLIVFSRCSSAGVHGVFVRDFLAGGPSGLRSRNPMCSDFSSDSMSFGTAGAFDAFGSFGAMFGVEVRVEFFCIIVTPNWNCGGRPAGKRNESPLVGDMLRVLATDGVREFLLKV